MRNNSLVVAFALTVTFSTQSPAQGVYLGSAEYDRLPACNAAAVKAAVSGAIARADRDYYGGRTIMVLDAIKETGYRADQPSPVARRYCHGHATLTDGAVPHVYYMIEEKAGLFGISWNVEACLSGLDRWRVYDGGCRTVRP